MSCRGWVHDSELPMATPTPVLRHSFSILCLSLVLTGPSDALASNGRTEINQTSIEAGGGFPHVLGKPGSYLLTSNLYVPDGRSGLQVSADDISLDLNGFAIVGPHDCGPVGCPSGSTVGVEAVAVGNDEAARTTLLNGQVRGFGADCVSLGTDARIEGLVVSSCGDDGVFTQERALVLRNRISTSGAYGLNLVSPASYSDNMIAYNGLAGGTGGPVSGGTDGGGNVCDTGSCSAGSVGPRRFYLSLTSHPGSEANDGASCSAGFHFASIWEIEDTASLRYDTMLGVTSDDSGAGPPSALNGWIRTGGPSTSVGDPGQANCDAWTATGVSFGTRGTVARLHDDWLDGASGPYQHEVSRWAASTVPCYFQYPVWCIED